MKKIVSILTLFVCLALLVSCGKEEKKENKAEAFTPLLRLTVDSENAEDTRLFYLPESDGFLYLHKNKEGGFTGGFVSTTRSISAEGFIESRGDLESVSVWEKEKDCAYILSNKELIFTLLKDGNAKATPLPESVSGKGAVPLNDLSFLEDTKSLVLLHPVDFAETYVLCDKTALTDFSGLLTVNENGKKIWYTKKSGNHFSGIGFFEYGKNIPLGNKNFAFDSFEKINSDSFLFIKEETEGAATYRYLNLKSEEEKVYIAKKAFSAVTASPDGSVLCGISQKGDGCIITVIDLEKGTEKGSHTIDYGKAAHSIAIDKSASTLLVAFGSGKDQILATLDLTKF